jgi:hypothetical protein
MKFSEFLINEMDGIQQGMQRGKHIMGGGNVNMAAAALDKLINGELPSGAERKAISGYLGKLKMVMADPQLDAAFMNLVKRGQREQGTQQAAQNMQNQARQ